MKNYFIYCIKKYQKVRPKNIIFEFINAIKLLFLFFEYKQLGDLKHKYLYKKLFINCVKRLFGFVI